MILLIDADFLAFSTAAGCQEKIKWDDDVITTHISMDQAKHVFATRVAELIELSGYDGAIDSHPPTVVMCWSCPTRRYHRHDVSASYKSGRTGDPPLGLRDVRAWAEAEYPSYTRDHLEADDVLGILATVPSLLAKYGWKTGDQVVVVSVDKDLLQIPGDHINPNRPELGIFTVTDEAAEHHLYMQALTGDPTDGYGGCPGMGPVRAERWLAQHGHSEKSLTMAYLKAGLTQQDAVDQFNLARILTGETYDFTKKQPILWNPSVTLGETV